MTTTYNLSAATNVTFRLTLDFSKIAALYDLTACIIRMRAYEPGRPNAIVYAWASDGSAPGSATFSPVTGRCLFEARSRFEMAALPPRLDYDCRLERAPAPPAPLFSGGLALVSRPVDQARAQEAGLGDTVFVDGDLNGGVLTPVEAEPPPADLISLTAALAAAQAALDATEAAAERARVGGAGQSFSGDRANVGSAEADGFRRLFAVPSIRYPG